MLTHLIFAFLAQASWSTSLTIDSTLGLALSDSTNLNKSLAAMFPSLALNQSNTEQRLRIFNTSDPTLSRTNITDSSTNLNSTSSRIILTDLPSHMTPVSYRTLIYTGILFVRETYPTATMIRIKGTGASAYINSPSQIDNLSIDFSLSPDLDERVTLNTIYPLDRERWLEWNFDDLSHGTISPFPADPITWPRDFDIFDAYELTETLSEGQFRQFSFFFYGWSWRTQQEVYRFYTNEGHDWELSTQTHTLVVRPPLGDSSLLSNQSLGIGLTAEGLTKGNTSASLLDTQS